MPTYQNYVIARGLAVVSGDLKGIPIFIDKPFGTHGPLIANGKIVRAVVPNSVILQTEEKNYFTRKPNGSIDYIKFLDPATSAVMGWGEYSHFDPVMPISTNETLYVSIGKAVEFLVTAIVQIARKVK